MQSLLFLVLFSMVVRAAEVISVSPDQAEVTISQDTEQPLKIGDSACIPGQKTRCGKVIQANSTQAIIRLNLVSKGIEVLPPEENAIEKGAIVKPLSPHPKKKSKLQKLLPPPRISEPPVVTTPNIENSTPTTSLPTYPKWNLSLGIGGGFDYFFPLLHVQRVFSNYILGLMPFYAPAGSVKARGTFITNTFPLEDAGFRGLEIQFNAAIYEIAQTIGNVENTGISMGLSSILGYRWLLAKELNLLLGVGGQYVIRLQGSQIDFSGLKPLYLFEIGYHF